MKLRLSKAEEMRRVNSGEFQAQFPIDSSVESLMDIAEAPLGLKFSPSCKNVWATKGIHFNSPNRRESAPKLVLILNSHDGQEISRR